MTMPEEITGDVLHNRLHVNGLRGAAVIHSLIPTDFGL